MLKLPTHAAFHDLFLNYSTWIIFPVDLMDLLFNEEKKIDNSTLADLETSYHLLTSIYYKNYDLKNKKINIRLYKDFKKAIYRAQH
jgi:hypothetical protein